MNGKGSYIKQTIPIRERSKKTTILWYTIFNLM